MAYTIVSVEDDPQIAELLEFVLQHEQISVYIAHDGKTGLEMIRAVRPNLILLDVMVPEINGWQIFDAVRADEALRHTPIIMVSVVSEQRDRKQSLAGSQIDSYFTKPFDIRRLRVEIERMLAASLWEMPESPPLRSTAQDKAAQDEAPQSAPLPEAATPDTAETPATVSGTASGTVSGTASGASAIDDTQPAVPLSPLRPAKLSLPPTADDSGTQHEEASTADT